MCIIVDSCVLPSVFRSSEKNHKNFKAVCDWIVTGDGTLVFGGTKFKKEITEHHLWFLKFLRLLKEQGKAFEADEKKVDARQKIVEKLENNPDFDDQHLVALIGVTGCKLICTVDKRAFKFLQDSSLYPKKIKPPLIYQNEKSHATLLCKANIGKCCNRSTKLNKSTRQSIGLPI